MKVLMAPVNISGMPLTLVRSLQEIGVDARLLQYARGEKAHQFGYDSDIVVQLDHRPAGEVRFNAVANALDEGYDIFHFWLRTMVFGPKYTGLMGADLPLIKLRGRRILYRFTGMDLRDPIIDLKDNPYSPFRYGYSATTPADEIVRRAYLEYLQCHVDQFLVQDPELGQYMPNAEIIPRALDLNQWPDVGVQPTDKPIVVHGPSNQLIKGTSFVLKACEELLEEGLNFELKLVTGMAHEEAVSWYKRSDILVDQLHIGAYGVLAMEGMALGKAVMCYIREDLFKPVYGEMPIINCNPDNFKDQLRKLIKDYEMRKDYGQRARAFVEEFHDVNKVAPQLKALYETVLAAPQHMPTGTADLRFLGMQYGSLEKQVGRQRSLVVRAESKTESLRDQIDDGKAELQEARRTSNNARKRIQSEVARARAAVRDELTEARNAARGARNEAASNRRELARYKKYVENAIRDRDSARLRVEEMRAQRGPNDMISKVVRIWRRKRDQLRRRTKN